jgi:hypothetical protein
MQIQCSRINRNNENILMMREITLLMKLAGMVVEHKQRKPTQDDKLKVMFVGKVQERQKIARARSPFSSCGRHDLEKIIR